MKCATTPMLVIAYIEAAEMIKKLVLLEPSIGDVKRAPSSFVKLIISMG